MNIENVRRLTVGVFLAATAASGAVCVGGTGEASAAVYPTGVVQGHQAFAIGPHGSAEACAPLAANLQSFGAKQYGSAFGECYYANGAWWARSPWAA